MHEEGEPVSPPAETRRRSLPRWILWRLSRLAVLLLTVFMVACVMVAQPSFRSNSPSNKTGDANRLKKHVVTLSETFHPRDSENLANLDRCAEYIAAELKQAGATVEFQEVPVLGRKYRNVIGRIGQGKARKLIVGAHYDAFDGTPGADDNASGVAGLLELARMIGADPPEAEVEFVAYTLEEPPFFGGNEMGSTVHAASAAKEKSRIIGVIVLEMIGYFSDEPGSQNYPLPILKGYYPSRGNFITVVSRWDQSRLISDLKAAMKGTTALPVYSFRGPASLPGVDFSDHRNYWPHGIPAAMVTNTAFYRNTAYHSPEDTAARLDYQRMAMVVVGVFEAVRQLSR